MILPEQLEGHGVTLRRWRPADAASLHRAVLESRDHLRPWMDWVAEEPLSVEERREMLTRWEEQWRAGGNVVYATLVDDGLVAGGCGLHHRGGPGVLEIGYWTHPAFLRRGIATAAARLLTDAVFALRGIEYAEIHHDKANVASRGIPQRLGYALIEERPDPRRAPAEVGIECRWRMARQDWISDRAPAMLDEPGAICDASPMLDEPGAICDAPPMLDEAGANSHAPPMRPRTGTS